MKKSKRRELTPREQEKAANLRRIWEERRRVSPEYTQEYVGALMGMTQGAVGQYVNGRIAVGIEAAIQFARVLGCSPAEISVDYEDLRRSDSPAADDIPETFAPVEVARRATPPGYVRFLVLESAVAAGDKGFVLEFPEVVQSLDIARWWVQQNLRAPPERIRVLTARGDSMRPDINNGDVLFIDSGVTQFAGDGVYVIWYRDTPKVKRLQLMRDGRIAIRSTNASYETEYDSPDAIRIGGLLLKAWSLKEF